MRILITNDDGIRAPGIVALYRAIADPDNQFGGPIADTVHVVAPLTVQSATSHGVTYAEPIMTSVESVAGAFEGDAVDGRPADCVKLAIANLWPERFGEGQKPDLVLSGINSGANVGINVIYSGTVAAAIEAAFLGIPSIALSLHIGTGRPDYTRAARHARRVVETIIASGIGQGRALSPHACLNVNIPICDDQAKPQTPDHPEIVVCPMNTHGLIDRYEKRSSPIGEPYYWASGHGLDFRAADDGTDVDIIFQRKIALTPLRYDLTRMTDLDRWRDTLASAQSIAD
ncbi:MAG: 5'/3'-nucleotidase SurE [Phycisphaerales bacterium]